MKITIIADASYCDNSGAAGYGFWIACERGRHGGGGSILTKVTGSIAAEMMALVNAICAAIKRELVQKGDFILLQTDCQGAIDAFLGVRTRLTPNEREAKERFFEVKRQHGFTFDFRHIKGHTGRPEARFVTNMMCDRRARKGMELARQKLRA